MKNRPRERPTSSEFPTDWVKSLPKKRGVRQPAFALQKAESLSLIRPSAYLSDSTFLAVCAAWAACSASRGARRSRRGLHSVTAIKAPLIVQRLIESGYNPPALYVDPHARLYQQFYDICATLGGLMHGIISLSGEDPLQFQNTALPFLHFDLRLSLPVGEVLKNAMDPRSELEPIRFSFLLNNTSSRGKNKIANISKIHHVISNVAKVEFISYFEDYYPVIKSYVMNSIPDLPKPWDFARVVRNAITHNGININDPNFMPVKWYWLEYGPLQNGQRILDVDMALPDLWILMFEMDDALSLVLGDERVAWPRVSYTE